MHTCAKLLRGLLLTLWKGAYSDPYKLFVHIQLWPNYCLEGDASSLGVLVGTGPAGWVGNIVLVGQPQIGEGHIPWPKYCIKWGRCWWAEVEKAAVENAARYGRYLPAISCAQTVCHLCNRLHWIKRLESGDRDYKCHNI